MGTEWLKGYVLSCSHVCCLFTLQTAVSLSGEKVGIELRRLKGKKKAGGATLILMILTLCLSLSGLMQQCGQ